MKNVTRNEQESCVMARVMREKVRHQKNFGLREFKTWRAAETAAVEWIRQIKETLPAETPRAWRMTVSNHSGVVNVFLQRHVVHKLTHDLVYWRWVARWPGCQLKGGLAWYVTDDRSDEDAFALAVLSTRLQSVDRSTIVGEFARVAKTREFEKILELKQDSVEARGG